MSKVSKELDARVRSHAQNRCGYCLAPQKLLSYVLEIEHLIPKAKNGSDEESNLWLACRQCNLNKGWKTSCYDPVTSKHVEIYNPRLQIWSEHFAWSEDKTEIIGRTPHGRATVFGLRMNNDLQRIARRFWRMTGIFPSEG